MNRIPKVRIGLLIAMILISLGAFGQRVQVRLDSARSLSGTMVDDIRVTIAKGNVQFTHEGTKIFCDSAVIFREQNRVEAFGRVRIIENDSTTITSRRANYDGTSGLVEFRRNVAFVQEGNISLFTDFLDYDRNSKKAIYYNGGELVDSINVLKSKRGYYNEYSKMASFGGDVKGENPDWDLASDTLQYHSGTKVIYFRGPTLLTNPDGEIAEYNSGNYNTSAKTSILKSGKFETRTYFLEGLEIDINDFKKLYRAKSNVTMVAKNDDVIISGQMAVYDKKNGITKIWDEPLMKKIVAPGDTLYLRADTLVSIEYPDGEDRLLAYPNVRLYKSDLQGIADSIAYHPKDSMMFFYVDPVMWTTDTQMSADTMNLEIANGTINKLNMNVNSFIISKDSTLNYNQVKGRNMTTWFKDEAIEKVDVNGNGQSIYYVLEQNNVDVMGMNTVECSNMLIKFKENMVHTITFYVNAEGDFIPPHELKVSDEKLEGFNWQIEKKPVLEDLVKTRPRILIDPTKIPGKK